MTSHDTSMHILRRRGYALRKAADAVERLGLQITGEHTAPAATVDDLMRAAEWILTGTDPYNLADLRLADLRPPERAAGEEVDDLTVRPAAVLYTSTPDRDQRDLDQQMADCVRHCTSHDYRISGVYTDTAINVTGRPGLQSAIDRTREYGLGGVLIAANSHRISHDAAVIGQVRGDLDWAHLETVHDKGTVRGEHR